MSIYTSTEWTCDRCARRVAVVERGWPGWPSGWAALYEVDPPLMSPSESIRVPTQVCGTCRRSYHDWLVAGLDEAEP